MKMKDLSNLIEIAKKARDIPISKNYWEKEEKILSELRDKRNKEAESIKMSHDKFKNTFFY